MKVVEGGKGGCVKGEEDCENGEDQNRMQWNSVSDREVRKGGERCDGDRGRR